VRSGQLGDRIVSVADQHPLVELLEPPGQHSEVEALEHELLDPASLRERLPLFRFDPDWWGLAEATAGYLLPDRAIAAHLAVADTGPGIPADALPHVFERFYRADPAHSRTVEGTGLGLAVVSSIVRAHGGEISVDSAVGRGTTVSVTLPALALAGEGDA
jgi:hypothetical protein